MSNTPAKLPIRDIAVGDCIATMRSWPAASLDLIFADPPYNIGYTYDKYEDKRSDEEYVDWTKQWITACADLLKPSGSFYVLIGDEYAAETRMHLKELERQKKLVFRNWIIWHYTFGQNCRTKFNRSHAHLMYCVGPALFDHKAKTVKDHAKAAKENAKASKDGADASNETPDANTTRKNKRAALPYCFNREAIAVASARQTTYADARANPGGKMPDDTWYLRPQEAEEAPRTNDQPLHFDADGDTWHLARLCGTFQERVAWHPCQLPEALLERVIKLSSNEGDIVFDPFTGSGTTLAVAARLKRQWLGCELSQDYADKAKLRINHVELTGETLMQTDAEKGIDRTITKKKPEPKRSSPAKSGSLFATEPAK